MKRTHLLPRLAITLALAAFLAPAPVRAADTLLDAVPGNVALVVHNRATDKDDFIEAYYAQVCDAFMNSGIIDDVVSLIRSNSTPEEIEQFTAVYERVKTLVGGVDWPSLVSQEMIFAMRWEEGDVVRITGNQVTVRMWPTELFLFRQTAEQADQNLAGLRAIQQAIAELGPNFLTITESAAHGGTLWSLNVANVMSFVLARHGNLIALGLERELVEESFALLAGDASAPAPITKNERYTSLVSQVPAGGSETSYADFQLMFGSIQRNIDEMFAALLLKEEENLAPGEPSSADEIKMVQRVIGRIFQELAGMDRSVDSVRVEGRQSIAESVMTMSDRVNESLIARLMVAQRPIENFARYVPVEAKNFTVASGAEMLPVYDGVVDIVAEFVPQVREFMGQFEGMVETYTGLTLREGILGWIGGTSVIVSLQGPMGQNNGIMMLGINDRERALTAITTLVTKLNGLLKQYGYAALITGAAPGDLGARGYITLTHPMLPMFQMFTPFIIGVEDDFLIIATTAEAAQKTLDTMEGKHPSILENERFKKEGVVPDGPAMIVSFRDRSNEGTEASLALQMGGSMMMMMGAGQAQGPEAEVLATFSRIVQKLGVIVGNFNFVRSTASVTTFDGKQWHTITKTTYID